MSEQTGPIETKAQFAQTPAGRQQYWQVELAAAKDNVKAWWADAERVIREYLGESTEAGRYRLNLFYADTTTRSANMSGLPKVTSRRRYADAADDVARTSAEILERLLNSDIDREEDGYRKSLARARSDWELAVLGVVRFRYVAEMEPVEETPAQTDEETGEELAPAVPAGEQKVEEDVETDYVHWKDFLWSPGRTWSDVRWVAYRTEMTRDELNDRFGEDKGKKVPLQKRPPGETDGISEDVKDAWSRAEVWEIWDKASRKRCMYADGMDEVLEEVDDPLGIPGFFPSPEPLCANATTSKYIPRPYYFLAESLYEEAHELTRRIRYLVKSIKVNGGFDASMPELGRMLDETCENKLIPVERWSFVKEKGGLANAVELLPIQQQIEAVIALVTQRNVVKSDLYEITGQSDIMRGQAAQKATATEQRIKARFGSSRIQAAQEEYARFASEGQRIRAAIITKMFDAETIVERSNILPRREEVEGATDPLEMGMAPPGMPMQPPPPPTGDTPDPQMVLKAIELLKSDGAAYRVEVEADSLSMTDFDAVQQESMGVLKAVTEYVVGWAPLVQAGGPAMATMSMEMLKVALASFRGGNRYEEIIDRAQKDMEAQAKIPKPPPPPDPKVVSAQVKAQSDQFKAKADVQKTQMDLQASTVKHGLEMQKIGAEVEQTKVETAARVVEAQTDAAMGARDTGMEA